ncbi:MAG: [FeFe] hydrogenase H-cluster maturation GTPase HydF [Lactobacillaceae bacterium]|jgi:[FeFe] hydrogenase H-cluster maturation GTPase HydF|nr:[FeFe] hydrogenase H-cluster maturation GTPase HydF [Lactobacillaceae bacterium]
MENTPKSLRKSIALAGKVNAGKSSLLNAIIGQDLAIVSDAPGTTNDAVGKAFELAGLGPVTFYDTAGFEDETSLAPMRIEAAKKTIENADLVLVVVADNKLGLWEEDFIKTIKSPFIIVYSKADIYHHPEGVSTITGQGIEELKNKIVEKLADEKEAKILDGLVNSKDKVLLIAPIDKSAPKGRLILPQVQILRELLDINALPTIVQPEEVKDAVKDTTFSLAITDSRVVKEVAEMLPKKQKLTTFSILFGRLKGDFAEYAKGAAKIDNLKDGDKILIAEACSHTTEEDDIARTILPKLLRAYAKKDLVFNICSGKDFPKDLESYALILHCGSCMLTVKETMVRIEKCKSLNVPITNYGLTISKCQGVFDRVIEPITGKKQ